VEITLAGNSLHEDDTALPFAEWIPSRPEATPGADDLAEQIGGGGGQVFWVVD
jgi:hypothetical protein